METLSIKDIDRDLSVDMRLHISDLTLMWASLDSAATFWVIRAFGMPLDAGSIMLGNMDTKTKFDKLYNLHRHAGLVKAAEGINDFRKQLADQSVTRNIVMHRRCVGVLKRAPTSYVFNSIKHITGRIGRLEAVILPLESVKLCTDFASHMGDEVFKMADRMTRPLTALMPPSFEPLE